MNQIAFPEWLDRGEYPFEHHSFQTAAGAMHYVDEGEGQPIVFVHGNPSWSFEFRGLIKRLSSQYRCIAPDHIGFGLSDKPAEWSYLPREQAANFESLMESLDLSDITLVVEDWGGPIGLTYAVAHPGKVKAVVILNSWAWSVQRDLYYQAFSKFTGGPLGRWLIKKRNFFARDIFRAVFGEKRRLTAQLHQHYLSPLAIPEQRKGSWVFPGEITRSSEWLAGIEPRLASLQSKKILIAWGLKDIAFREKELNRWISIFPHARVVRFADAGHFVPEERPADLSAEIARLMD